MDGGELDLSEDSDDAYMRDEIEAKLYSQIYHNTSDCVTSENVLKLCNDEAVTDIGVGPVASPAIGSVAQPAMDTKISYVLSDGVGSFTSCDSKQQRKDMKVYCISDSSELSSGDDSDIQVVKEVVRVTHELSSPECPAVSESKKRKRKLSAAESEDEDDVPFWSRLDSGTQTGDNSLSLNIRTHDRQRHDSIISRGSSALGDEADPLVTLREGQYESLEDILDSLPDEGWDIIHTDYTVSSLSNRKSLRYHNLRCRNCDEKGHVSSVCTVPKKEKACSLCSEVHHRPKDKRHCPYAICVWCAQSGHYKNHCYLSNSLRTTKCRRCNQRGHNSKTCHELWRQYHATTHLQDGVIYPTIPEVEVKKDVLYCANCSFQGHTAHECRRSSFSYTNQALPVHVLHYNTFGAVKDFGRRWTHRGAEHDNELEYNRKSPDVDPTPDEGLFVLPKHLRRNNKLKRHRHDEIVEPKKARSGTNHIISNNIGNNITPHKLTRKERKAKKLEKKIAKRDGPVVKFKKVAHGQSEASTSQPQVQSVEQSIQVTFSSKKLFKKNKKRNMDINVGKAEASSKTPPTKVLKNKKANERKKNRKTQIGKEKRERKSTVVDGQMLELMMRSKTVRSWNDAF